MIRNAPNTFSRFVPHEDNARLAALESARLNKIGEKSAGNGGLHPFKSYVANTGPHCGGTSSRVFNFLQRDSTAHQPALVKQNGQVSFDMPALRASPSFPKPDWLNQAPENIWKNSKCCA